MSATEYCSNEHNPTAWNVKRRAKENCPLSWPLAPKRHNSLETGSYCSGEEEVEEEALIMEELDEFGYAVDDDHSNLKNIEEDIPEYEKEE